MIRISIAYSKKLGLPQYSSHSASASLELELSDVRQAPGEIIRHYTMLQTALDQQLMQQPGFVPDENYATNSSGNIISSLDPAAAIPASNGSHHQPPAEVPTAATLAPPAAASTWQCSAKQHKLITDLQRRLDLSDEQVDQRARRLFGKAAHQLNKLSASGLISDLLAEAGPRRTQNGAQHAAPASGNGGQA